MVLRSWKWVAPSQPKRHWTLFSHSSNWEEVLHCLLLFFFLIFIHAYSRIVISGRELGKAKKVSKNEQQNIDIKKNCVLGTKPAALNLIYLV